MQFPSQSRTGTGVDFLFYLSLMKTICLFLLLIFHGLFTACSNSAVSKKLSQCDSLVINFKEEQSDTIIKTVSATENSAIDKLAGFVDSKTTEEFKCGYDGNMMFYSKGQAVLPIVFKYKESGCRHFLFELDGKLMSTKLSTEAADFLESLEKGNNQY